MKILVIRGRSGSIHRLVEKQSGSQPTYTDIGLPFGVHTTTTTKESLVMETMSSSTPRRAYGTGKRTAGQGYLYSLVADHRKFPTADH
jgi:hypothetical protein